MTVLKHTISLCPECFADIPAAILEIEGRVIMRKSCPEHGLFHGVVERDAEFYKLVQRNNSSMFYGGLIIDVTYRCNIRCKWCFQHLSNEDVPIEQIFAKAQTMPRGSNIILSGGEPTLRRDLPEIARGLCERGYVCNVITNGFNLDWSLPCRWTLSHHPESEETFNFRVAEAREQGKKLASIIYTDNSLTDFYQHTQDALDLADVCEVFRMHAAAPVGGNLDDQTAGVFVSDMYKLLFGKGHQLQMYPAKTIFAPITVDNVPFMLISWNDKNNVDVIENYCEPWYYGKGQTIDNLVTRIIRDN